VPVLVILLAVVAALGLALVLHARLTALVADMEMKHKIAQEFVRTSSSDSATVFGEAAKLTAKIEATRSFLTDELDKAKIKVNLSGS
jgi:type IV secretory pathway TrbL component